MRTQHAQSSCQKEYLYREYVQQYTESRYIKSVACTNMHNSSLINGIECICISLYICECVYHHYQTGLLYATLCHYDYVQVQCEQQCKRVHKCEPVGAHACSCTMCEL